MHKLRFFIYFCFACLTQVYAQTSVQLGERDVFTQLDWEELKIDSMLHYYTEVVPLETDYRLYDYQVSLDYPQYVPLTKAETKIAKQYDAQLSDSIVVQSYVGVQRRKGMLDIAFLPVIKKDGKYQKLLSARISIKATPKNLPKRAASRASSRYASTSRLAEGKWERIKITSDGMYCLTRQALLDMGFAHPENVHLYGYGGHRLPEKITEISHYDDLPEVPLYYNAQRDVWLFWGNGLMYWNGNTRVLNHYANAAFYFLHEESTPSSIPVKPYEQLSVTRTESFVTDHELYEKDEFAWVAYGRNLYEANNYALNNNVSYSLQSYQAQDNEVLEIAFSAFTSKTASRVTPTVNASTLGAFSVSASGKYDHAVVGIRTYDVHSYKSASNPDSWKISLGLTTGVEGHLDYLALHYRRPMSLRNGFMLFNSSTSTTRYNIAGQGIKVMRLASPIVSSLIYEGKQEGGTYSVDISGGGIQYVAFDPNYDFPKPVHVGTVANQNLHGVDNVDMVIIVPTSGKLTAQAQRLAQVHTEYDGLRCAIVTAQQIYNEYSSGTPDATAYRLFMKMLYDRGAATSAGPRYLLLMGDGVFDNRMLSSACRNFKQDDFLLCFESENSTSSTKSYVMEDYFALLDDNEGANLLKDKPDIGVGRLPATTAEEATIMVDKIVNYITNAYPGSWKNLVCMLGDDGDNNEHMEMSYDVTKRIRHDQPNTELRLYMWDTYNVSFASNGASYPQLTKALVKQMKDGASVMNYTGHGNDYALSGEYVLMKDNFVKNITNKTGLWVTAACDVMPFDGVTENTGEMAMLTKGGGTMSFYGTTRTVYASKNLHMNRYFMHYLFAKDAEGRRNAIGDAIYLAKNSIIKDGQEGIYSENKLQYVLLGDPALVIGAPKNNVILDNINGNTPAADLLLKAGQHVTLKGHINDEHGAALTQFNGVVTASIYDNEEVFTGLNNQLAADTLFTYIDRNIVYFGQDSVKNGMFELTFVVPVDINYSELPGRIVFYAYDTKNHFEANGSTSLYSFGGISDELKGDTIGPKISMYLNSEDFQNGQEVNSTPYFVAKLEDESGISIMGSGIGHDLSLTIDHRPDMVYNLNDYYVGEFGDFRRGTVSYNIPYLEDGPHTLNFRAWDVLNNTNAQSMDFVVNAALRPQILRIIASQNPAVNSTTFIVTTDRPGSECTLTIDVFDFMGRNLWRHTEQNTSDTGVFSIPWNLTNGSGGRLGSGIYLYRCTLQCGESKEATQAQKIVVLNNK